MERHRLQCDCPATLLILTELEYDEFIAKILPVFCDDSEYIDILIDTEYMPFLERTNKTSSIFDIYSITTNALVVIGPRGHQSAEIVLNHLETSNYYHPFSSN